MFELVAKMAMVALVAGVAACSPQPEGLSESSGTGPMVVWDLEAKPLPDIPFPNDLATRYDASSPTKRRLNLSTLAPTTLEAEIREKADGLDGFGTFAPITVSFDAPIDLDDMARRHTENRDFEDDAVFVIDITPASPTYGQPVLLDMGRGFFPLTLKVTDAYFANDPRDQGSNLLFESYEEKEGEDTDADGIIDRPNVHPEGGDPWDDLLTHYEKQTNTLLARPVVPLREKTTYAVVVTRRLHGEKGTGAACAADGDCPAEAGCDKKAGRCREPIRSPFRWSNHTRQTEELSRLRSILPGAPFKLDTSDVAFAWVFTTQSVTDTMVAIRSGLYGTGAMSALASDFPARYRLTPAKSEELAKKTGSLYVISIDELRAIGEPLLPSLKGMVPSLADSADALLASYDHLSYFVAGTFESPNFLVDRDGIATENHPADDDESFDVNPATGEAIYGTGRVPFICMIPKERPGYTDKQFPEQTGKKPFPVALFMHGTASSKLQAMGFGGFFARLGIATCAIDGFAHGMPFPTHPVKGISEDLILTLVEAFAPGYTQVYTIMKGIRVRDLNMDGNLDPAGDFWTMDPFHTRDCIRQTAVDLMQFLRTLRAMDGKNKADVDGDGQEELLGDFDEDGVVDIGGPDNRYFAYGISLGGIVTSVFAGAEPALDAAVVIVGGGGLADVAIRSTNPGVPEMAVMPALGPVIVGDLDPETGESVIRFVMPVFDHSDLLEMARLSRAKVGRTVRLTNLDTADSRHAVIPESGSYRIQLQADALRATEIRGFTGFDSLEKLGGGACIQDDECPASLKCKSKVCTCSGDDQCPDGYGCASMGACMQLPQPIDTTVATDEHPALGDRFLIEVIDEEGEVIETVQGFEKDVTANGIIYPAGAPLVNLYRGFGNPRQTPDFRRFMTIAQTILEPGDPVNWAPHFAREPIPYPDSDPGEDYGTNVLVLLGVGDTNVPLATGMAIARASGALGFEEADGRFGDQTEMEVLIDKHVTEGVFNRCHYELDATAADGNTENRCVLYDADDLDDSRLAGEPESCLLSYDSKGVPTGFYVCADKDGKPCGDGFGLPFDLPEPVRATAVVGDDGKAVSARGSACKEKHTDGTCRVFRDDQGVQALRLAVTRPEGFHGIYLMAPYKPFDIETYQLNLIARYFVSSGREVWDDACLEDSTCPWEP
jgi:pimeloyl-ACP methyl ester carboxylesterase